MLQSWMYVIFFMILGSVISWVIFLVLLRSIWKWLQWGGGEEDAGRAF
jgi:hypothetical protein